MTGKRQAISMRVFRVFWFFVMLLFGVAFGIIAVNMANRPELLGWLMVSGAFALLSIYGFVFAQRSVAIARLREDLADNVEDASPEQDSVVPEYLDIDTPLPPPTYRSLIPAHYFAMDTIVFNSLAELEAVPEVKRNPRWDDTVGKGLTMWRSNSAEYGETQGVILIHTAGKPYRYRDTDDIEGWTYDGAQYLALVDGKPVMQTFFDDPYHNLAIKKAK
jgi:hypothetical protein